MIIRPGTPNDIELLAEFNHQLVADMGSSDNWNLAEYEDRFREWITSSDWSVDTFDLEGTTVGYSVYQPRPDYYDLNQTVIYIRQFFIAREHRRKGLGKMAFKLLNDRFPEHVSLALDVLASNPDGATFWQSLGFAPYYTAMKKSV